MKKQLLFIFYLLLLCLTGCSSTYYIKNDPTSLDEFNEELQGNAGTIVLKDGPDISARRMHINEDSSSWVEVKTFLNVTKLAKDTSRAATADIEKIVLKNKGLGAVEGLAFGAIGGSFVGKIMASNQGDDLKKQLDAGIGSLLLGTVGGAVLGLMIGHSYHYILTDSEEARRNKEEAFKQQVSGTEDTSAVKVEFSSIIQKGSEYLVILWQSKKIRLERPDYHYRGTSEDGQQYIVVPVYIYKSKFER